MLQVFTVGLLCFLSQPLITPRLWNSLFWISIVFCTLQAISKSFIHISPGRWIYLNQLSGPGPIILSKILYAWLLMCLLSGTNLVIFSFFMGFPVEHALLYMGFLLFASLGLGTVYTLSAAIASKTSNPGFLVPVLSLPVILPLILVGVQGSEKCFNPVLVSSTLTDLLLLGALDLLLIILATVLFLPLWRD